MKELPFGPYYLYTTHYSFSDHFYACLSNKINLVSLGTFECTDLVHPDNLQPVFLRLAYKQQILDDFPAVYAMYENGECYEILYQKGNTQFTSISSTTLFGMLLPAHERCIFANGQAVVTVSGQVIDLDSRQIVMRGSARPRTQILEFGQFSALAYCDNTIRCTDGHVFEFRRADAVSMRQIGENSYIINFPINDAFFYVACFYFFGYYLIVVMNTGHFVALNLQTGEVITEHLFSCETYPMVKRTGMNLDENFLYPIHMICTTNKGFVNIRLFVVEAPVKNTFIQTTRVIDQLTNIQVIEQEPTKRTDFFPYDPISNQTIMLPDFGCPVCNYGFLAEELTDWSCSGCKRSLVRYAY